MKRATTCLVIVVLSGLILGMARWAVVRMGKQPDGSFLVSSGQRVEGGSIAFSGRPVALALHPSGQFYAILRKKKVSLGTRTGIIDGSDGWLRVQAAFRGIAWSPDGRRLFASTDSGLIQTFQRRGEKLRFDTSIKIRSPHDPRNPVPGGIVFTRDGTRMFVAAANLNSVVVVDPFRYERIREYPVQNLPFEVKLSEDEKTLIVSNWGGRIANPGERTSKSQDHDIPVDERGVPVSGTVSLIDRKTGETRHVAVGLHPTAIAVSGGRAYVANAMSDSISEIDIATAEVVRTILLRWGKLRVLGGMPNDLAVFGKTLYVVNGGDNAVCEVDLVQGRVLGYRHAGYFPISIALSHDGKTAFVLNAKGNGSVSRTLLGLPGNAHDFQGTVTLVDLTAPIDRETAIVARNNRWDAEPGLPNLKVYNGAIKHVLYIIKENRTYDEVFGDLPQGEGDPKLCSLGEKVMPNHRKLAREFTLFDNSYVCGTDSVDGHAWSTQCIANDYLEHFYVGYSRTYPFDGDDAMAISGGGALWDAALKKQKTLRVWGEFCDEKLARFDPEPKDWFELWEDRKNKTHRITMRAGTTVASLKPYINREVHCWPLLQSDQYRADVFIREYQEFSRQDKIPDLMIMSLPCDHGEGMDPKYPSPRAMMADNDLALGRVVEAVSRSPQWKETCIFVVEDDAQSGPDHIDGHRTVYLVVSPFARRGYVDSTFYTQTNMIRSIEMMLGLDPMNKFDAVADPMTTCFTDTPDLTPYHLVPNNVPLDERNPSGMKGGHIDPKMTQADRYWIEKTQELDWSHIDAPDPYWLNRINWYSIHRGSRPYPGRPGEKPGQADAD